MPDEPSPASIEIELDGLLARVLERVAALGVTAALIALDARTTITAVGELGDVAIGTPLRLRGAWADQAERTLRVTDYALRAPDSAEEIERFLGSGFFPGIGRDLARRIVAQLGADALRVIEAEPARLLTIPGIGASRAARVTATYTQHRHLADTTTLLGAHGATAAFASRMGRHGGVAIWLPTSPAVVAAMLDLAQVTAADELIDLAPATA
ncbi:MAG: hypothetical protein IPL61_39065 [Myxococcales bacterium]|nr:hypothetical protein [Myxococcales bacterium]